MVHWCWSLCDRTFPIARCAGRPARDDPSSESGIARSEPWVGRSRHPPTRRSGRLAPVVLKNSSLYECSVLHRRTWPKRHAFVYRIFLFCLDLDELGNFETGHPVFGVNEPALYSFRDEDHFRLVPGNARANAEAFLKKNGISERPASIRLLTNARFLGYTFNPISIWFCSRQDGSPLAAIAEVGNTFRELKPFLVPPEGKGFHLRAPKHFYVSPFSALDLEFDFRFEEPGARLAVYIDDYRGEERVLASALTGKQLPLTTANLLGLTAKYPFITLKVIALIHWQALRLWVKGLPYFRKEESADLQKDVFNRRA